ncbi:MAG: transcription initiation factor IIB family protein [Candidatus Nanohaloarchaea archaeon]
MTEVETQESTIPVKSKLKEADKDEDSEEEQLECPECGSTEFIENSAKGELYCMECGNVVEEDRIDTSKEWRAFDSGEKDKKARAGGSVTYTEADRGIGTEMGKSYEMNNVSGRKRQQYYRMRKWSRRTSDSQERSLEDALKPIQNITSQLKLPDSVSEEAARLAEKARDEGIFKGQGTRPTAAALVYIVSRQQNVPRSLDEISDVTGIKKKKLGDSYRKTARELGLEMNPAQPEEFLPRYAEKLGLSGEGQADARKILEKAREEGVQAGKAPKTMVAGAIYLAGKLNDEEFTQKEISDEIGVTEVTIRNSYQDMLEVLNLDEEQLE